MIQNLHLRIHKEIKEISIEYSCLQIEENREVDLLCLRNGLIKNSEGWISLEEKEMVVDL